MSPKSAVLYVLLLLTAVFLPIVLWGLNLPIISNTYGKNQELFELFGLSAAVGLAVVVFVEIRQRPNDFFRSDWLPVLALAFVGFHFLILINEYSLKSWDYLCYENAAVALRQGADAYADTPERCYLYPPLLAQGLAGLFGLMTPLLGLFSAVADGGWQVVFYLYQVAQFLLILLTFSLCYHFGRILGLPIIPAVLVVAALFLLNNPLIRTLRHNQVNLWMLDVLLLAILWLRRRPIWAGTAVAVGAHLKLFSVVLLPIWLVTKQWRGLVGAGVGFLVILIVQTSFGRNWVLWQQFLDFYLTQPLLRFIRYRNNSLQSVIVGSMQTLGLGNWVEANTFMVIANVLVALATLAVLAWFVWRFVQRQQLWETADADWRLFGHSMDALALVLIASPITWEHHYVLAMPLIVWAAALFGRATPWLIGISAFLMLGLPTFDVFPLSYHRLAGILLWIYLTSPTRVSAEALPERQS